MFQLLQFWKCAIVVFRSTHPPKNKNSPKALERAITHQSIDRRAFYMLELWSFLLRHM